VEKPLTDEYLQLLYSILGKIYAAHVPPTVEDYSRLVTASLKALVNFTGIAPPALLQQPPSTALFHTTEPLSAILDPDLLSYLRGPFNVQGKHLTWLFDQDHDTPYQWSQLSTFRQEEYTEDVKKAQKWAEDVWKDATLEQRALSSSPFYRYAADLFTNVTITQPFIIPKERWFEGTWIVAAQGRGKTNLLRHLILHHLKEPCCIIIMDAKASGDLVRSFDSLAMLKDRLVILSPDVEHPLAINPLDIGAKSYEFLEYIFSALLETKLTPNQSTLFRMVLRLCVLIPGATLDTFREVLQKGWKPYEPYMRQLPKREQDFFDHQFNTKGYTERRPEVVARLYTLMSNPVLDAIFQAKETKLDMFELINKPNVICIENNEEQLGEQGAEFFGRLMVSLVWSATRKRGGMKDEDKLPVYFVIDEAHYTIARDPKVAAIIEQCRAQKVGMIFSHQRIDHIKDQDVLGALNNCAIKLVNTTGEAHELAPRLQTTADFIKSQKRGQFACYVVDATDTAISLSVPKVDMGQYPRMSRAEIDALTYRMHVKYCQGTPQAPPPHNQPQDDDPDDDTAYEEHSLNPITARKGGTWSFRYRVRPDDVEFTMKSLKVPPDTKSGARFRIRGFGQFRRDGTRGDVVVTFTVMEKAQSTQVALYGVDDDPNEIG
jgi:hypothetical protein